MSTNALKLGSTQTMEDWGEGKTEKLRNCACGSVFSNPIQQLNPLWEKVV
jgi:hypothetical protein